MHIETQQEVSTPDVLLNIILNPKTEDSGFVFQVGYIPTALY